MRVWRKKKQGALIPLNLHRANALTDDDAYRGLWKSVVPSGGDTN